MSAASLAPGEQAPAGDKFLCATCQNIDFGALYGGKRLNDEARVSKSSVLGTPNEIRDRASSCRFCAWISDNFTFHQQKDHRLKLHSAQTRLKLKIDGSAAWGGYERREGKGYLNPMPRLKHEPWDVQHSEIADIRCVHRQVKLAGASRIGRVLDRSNTVVEQCSLWLRECREEHEHYGIPGATPTHSAEVQGFQLVDVHKRRVVASSAHSYYFALSYVWGPDQQCTTIADGELPRILPETIEDAIQFTKLMGFRYLWVDALCIPQNDLPVRLAQIRQMDVIYQQATLTLIATGGAAQCGLNGFSRNANPQRSIEVDEFLIEWQPAPWRFLMAYHGGVDTLFEPWSSRGWTFQEANMSARRIIFMESQDRIIFECSDGARQTHPTDAIEPLKSRFFNDLDSTSNRSRLEWNMHLYQHMLNMYLQRQLTYERDIVNAFMGVANRIAHNVGSETCWTIPKRSFLVGLMWAPHEKASSVQPRQVVLEDGRMPPSWHWSSLVLPKGIAFVQGSEPVQLYNSANEGFTTQWTDEEWNHLEATGLLKFEGEVIDFESQSEDDGAAAAPNMPPTRVRGDAQGRWKQRRGRFLSCESWKNASTLEDIKEVNPIAPFAQRLGKPTVMQPNLQFAICVEPDTEDEPDGSLRRVGWLIVKISAWLEASPRKGTFHLQ